MCKISYKGDFPGGPVAKNLAEGPGSIPGQGTRFYMLQIRIHMSQQRSFMLQLRPGRAKQMITIKKKKTLQGYIIKHKKNSQYFTITISSNVEYNL